jgi:hypothetical protein
MARCWRLHLRSAMTVRLVLQRARAPKQHGASGVNTMCKLVPPPILCDYTAYRSKNCA